MALFLGQNIVVKKPIYRLRRRERENVLISLQPVFNPSERTRALTSRFAAGH